MNAIGLTPKQSRRVNALIRCMCCNYDNGHCILLDDGAPCVCPQTITYSHIVCHCFKAAVLPLDKVLYIELIKPENTKKCAVCGKEYVYRGNKSKCCPDCKKAVRRRKQAGYQRKYAQKRGINEQIGR